MTNLHLIIHICPHEKCHPISNFLFLHSTQFVASLWQWHYIVISTDSSWVIMWYQCQCSDSHENNQHNHIWTISLQYNILHVFLWFIFVVPVFNNSLSIHLLCHVGHNITLKEIPFPSNKHYSDKRNWYHENRFKWE